VVRLFMCSWVCVCVCVVCVVCLGVWVVLFWVCVFLDGYVWCAYVCVIFACE